MCIRHGKYMANVFINEIISNSAENHREDKPISNTSFLNFYFKKIFVVMTNISAASEN